MDRHERGDLAQKLYEEDGLIMREVAERLGVSKTTIHRDLRDRNVKMRPGPEFYRQQRLAQQILRRAEKRRKKLAEDATAESVI